MGNAELYGYYAWTYCLIKGSYNSKVIYEYIKKIQSRDLNSYKDCLKLLHGSRGRQRKSIYGIKGPTNLSAYVDILQDVLYDNMHLCCEGYINRFLNLITNSTNHNESYYIGKILA